MCYALDMSCGARKAFSWRRRCHGIAVTDEVYLSPTATYRMAKPYIEFAGSPCRGAAQCAHWAEGFGANISSCEATYRQNKAVIREAFQYYRLMQKTGIHHGCRLLTVRHIGIWRTKLSQFFELWAEMKWFEIIVNLP